MAEASSKYPRAAPFKPPPAESAAEGAPPLLTRPSLSLDASFRAWAVRLAIGVVASVAIIASLTVFTIIMVLKPGDPPLAASSRTARAELASPPTVSAARLDKSPPTKAKTPLPRPSQPPPPPHADPSDRALETVGSLSAAHLYQTYLNLGLLADNTEHDIYNDADAKKMLTTLTDLIDTVDRQLVKFAEGGLGPEDRKKLERVRGLAVLLRIQAAELRAYWDTADTDPDAKKEREAKFHEARRTAWTGIKESLGIKEEEPAPP